MLSAAHNTQVQGLVCKISWRQEEGALTLESLLPMKTWEDQDLHPARQYSALATSRPGRCNPAASGGHYNSSFCGS